MIILEIKIGQQRKCCLDITRSHTIKEGGSQCSGIFDHTKMKTSSVVMDQVIPCVGEGTQRGLILLGDKNRS